MFGTLANLIHRSQSAVALTCAYKKTKFGSIISQHYPTYWKLIAASRLTSFIFIFHWISTVHVIFWKRENNSDVWTQGFPFASVSSRKVVIFCTKMHNNCEEILLFTRAESISRSFSFFMAIFVFASHPASFFCGKSSFALPSAFLHMTSRSFRSSP